MSPGLVYAARSDRGLVRQNNEDSAYAGPRLLALADGMGGHAAGEVASQTVIAALAPLDEDQPGSDLTGALVEAMDVGNGAIATHVEAHPETDGMGCTLTALLFDGRRAGLLHVGDSRAYLLRDGTLTQITRDDTFVQSLVDEGKLSADEAHSHPQRSLILKALTGDPVEPTAVTREVRTGDRYLLCSDGLSDPVSTDTIAETLGTGRVDDAAERLVSLALRSGGPDNVTVVVAEVVENPRRSAAAPVVVGAASTEAAEDSPSDTAAGRAAAFSRSRDAARATPETVEPRAASSEAGPADAAPPRGSRWKFAASVLGVLVLLGGIAVISTVLVRSNYFVAANDSQVVVKRGISGEVLGLHLASVSQVACLAEDGELTMHPSDQIPPGCDVLTLGDLTEPARETVRAGLPSGSLDDARGQVERLARENLLPDCADLEKKRQPARKDPRPVTTTPGAPAPSPSPTTPPPGDPAASTAPNAGAPTNAPAPVGPAPAPGQNCRAVS